MSALDLHFVIMFSGIFRGGGLCAMLRSPQFYQTNSQDSANLLAFMLALNLM